MLVDFDADEGRFVSVGCLACHHEEAVLGIATPVRMYVGSVDCRECGEPLVSYDVLTRQCGDEPLLDMGLNEEICI